jgi:hypothetical protein
VASLPDERQGGGLPVPDPDRLVATLAGHGIAAVVEAHGRLAVLTLRGPSGVPAPAVRALILAAGRAAGFSTVAVELASLTGSQA